MCQDVRIFCKARYSPLCKELKCRDNLRRQLNIKTVLQPPHVICGHSASNCRSICIHDCLYLPLPRSKLYFAHRAVLTNRHSVGRKLQTRPGALTVGPDVVQTSRSRKCAFPSAALQPFHRYLARVAQASPRLQPLPA